MKENQNKTNMYYTFNNVSPNVSFPNKYSFRLCLKDQCLERKEKKWYQEKRKETNYLFFYFGARVVNLFYYCINRGGGLNPPFF